jgi:4-hydroxy-3-methylbut-2-enyl diphosphate reductase
VIIAGEADHPEVRALVDFVSGDAHVVRDASAAGRLKLPRNKKISMISQTTQAVDNLIDIVNAVLRKRPKELRIVNTICRDVEERQAAARSLAEEVDAMLIVGGRNSANTKRLLGICRGISKWSYLVESAQEVKNEWFRNAGVVGITSGASTPAGIVREVAFKVNHCGKEEKSKRKGLYN